MELVDAIRFQCRETSVHAGIEGNVLAPDDLPGLAERAKEQCFLCFREALGNAACHANADRIDVILEVPVPGRLTLKIIDDGVGFDTHKGFQRPAGLGLSMIQERVASVGGQAEILSVVGSGYVLKDSAFEELLFAVRTVAAGGTFMTPSIQAKLRDLKRRGCTTVTLSARGRDVIRLIASGNSSKEIARILDISPATVGTYRNRLMAKLSLHTVADVVRYAVRAGMVD